MSTGWIKLHRQFLDWEWYDDMNTKCLYLHCLLRANHSDAKWRGIDVKKGQFITSLDSLSSETGLSVQKIRTSLNKLKSTGNITSKQQAKARIITVVGWDDYQEVNKESNKQATGKQQATNRQLTPDKNVRSKECKNDKNNDIVAKAPRRFTPPTDIETVAYFIEKGSTNIEAEKFWLFYDSKNWMVGKSKMKKWKSSASGWIARNKTEISKADPLAASSASNWHEEDLGL